MFNFETQQYPILSMHLACQKFYNIKQGKFEELTNYHKRFKTIVDVLDHYGANIWAHPSLIIQEYKNNGDTEILEENIYDNMEEFNKHKLSVKNKSIAFAFLKGAQRDRYGNLAFELRSQYAREINQYPKTLNQAFRLLSTHKKKKRERQNDGNKRDKENEEEEEKSQNENKEMAFVQNTNKKTPECFLCGGEHYVTTCPYRNQFKKIRMNEQHKPPPVSANSMLINNATCQEIDDDTDEDEISNVYEFSFTNISTHPITNTQKIILSQNAKGKKIN